MNCKPGDLAVCIKHSGLTPTSPLGRFCTVLRASPLEDHRLPDGQLQIGRRARGQADQVEWVVEWAQEIVYPLDTGQFRRTRYGVCIDSALRPIRDPGEDAKDETLEWLPVPAKVSA